jgi:Uma2 family endonuclease
LRKRWVTRDRNDATREVLTSLAAGATCAIMPRATSEPITAAEYRAMPEGPPYYELIEGELVMEPSPSSHQQEIAGNVFSLLRAHVRAQQLGKVLIAPLDVFLSEANVLQPDVLFLANANLSLLRDDGVHGAPDLVVEVVSPSNGANELKRKRPIYVRSGVKEEWLIVPTLEQIHRYDFAIDSAKPVQIIDSGESFTTPLLPGLTIKAADVFER